jgi:hypothetical protein
VYFDPFPIVNFSPVLFIEPADKGARTEARGIDRKVVLNAFQGQATQRHRLGEYVGQFRISKVVRNTIKVRDGVDMLFGLRFA